MDHTSSGSTQCDWICLFKKVLGPIHYVPKLVIMNIIVAVRRHTLIVLTTAVEVCFVKPSGPR